MDAGIVPVKRLDQAKSRLGDAFGNPVRVLIARALMNEVLDLAATRGFATVRDPGAGLNRALVLAIDEVLSLGGLSVTIVPADVPLTATDDIADLIDTGATSDVVLVPSRSDGGTNCLYMRPPGLIPPSFGNGSLAAHAESAWARGLRCSILSLRRMELDIDTPEDVDALLATRSTSRTAAVLGELQSRD
jgi:2-phospho-L-lactate/phosphoenolpyruvate guanylyltransferase